MFSTTVRQCWRTHEARIEPMPTQPGCADRTSDTASPARVTIDPSLPPSRQLMLVEPVSGEPRLWLSPAMAKQLGLAADDRIDRAELSAALRATMRVLNGADQLFYFPHASQAPLCAEPVADTIRPLDAADADAFAAFQAQAPAHERDEAFVELDHWRVHGAFVDGRLACVASMLPWAGTRLADLGVLTLPALRGRGLAWRTVRAIAATALSAGFEPQYRCQPHNLASVALAGRAGLRLFGRWDVLEDTDG